MIFFKSLGPITLPAILLSVVLAADKDDPETELIEFRPKPGISKDEREIVEAILKRRRTQYDAAMQVIEDIDAELPNLKKALVRPTMKNRKSQGNVDAKGNWVFASKEE